MRRWAETATVNRVAIRAYERSSADRVAIVTGGSRGLGRDVACSLAERRFAVVVVYVHDQRAAEAAVDEILAANGTATAIRADVTDELDVERLFSETEAQFGGVDVVVDTAVVDRHASRWLRKGGAVVTVSGTEEVDDLLDFVDRWRPGM